MIVCSCNVLSDAKIKSAIDAHTAVGPRTPTALYKCLGCSPNCGRCLRTIRKIMDDAMHSHAAREQACDGRGCDHPGEPCPRRAADTPAFLAARVEAAACPAE